MARGRLDRRTVRRRPGAVGGTAADAPEHRRADGPGAGGRRGGRPPGDRRDRAADPAEAAADALGGRTALRRRRDRGLAVGGGRAGARRGRCGRGGGRARAARDGRRRPRRADGGGCRDPRTRLRRRDEGAQRARDPQRRGAASRRPHRGLAPPQAPRRPAARGGAPHRQRRRAGDRGLGAGRRHRADASGAAGRGGRGPPGRGHRRVARRRGRRPDRRRAVRQRSRASSAFSQTTDGLVLFLTLGVDASSTLDEAHRRASQIEEEIRAALPGISEIIVHTEP